MKKLFWIAVLIVILASFFASTLPDGLDFAAQKLGFAERGLERPAPMALTGIAGVLIILSVFRLVVFLLNKYAAIKS